MLLRPDGFRARQARHKTRDQAGLGAADFTSFVGFRDLPIPCATAMSEETSSPIDLKTLVHTTVQDHRSMVYEKKC